MTGYPALANFRFAITARAEEAAQMLEVACPTENDALEAAMMFAEDAHRVELWRAETMIWSGGAAQTRQGQANQR
jgi:hypothetical protein